jgi:hypothetical protein
MRAGWCAGVALTAMFAGCGGTATGTATHGGAAASYLLRLDQLVSPGFTQDVAAHPLSADQLSATGGGPAASLTSADLAGAASEEFFRTVPRLDLANGPVQVTDTVLVFGSPAGAATIYDGDVARLDAVSGAAAVSTGPLGDAAHATTRTVLSAGVRLVENTLEWRVDNLVTILRLRGRDGGTRLDDALVLAHRQTVTELGLDTPAPRTTPSTGASPRST